MASRAGVGTSIGDNMEENVVTTTVEEVPDYSPIKLTLPGDEREHDSGPLLAEAVLPVRWCINPDLREKLKEHAALSPHVLFSIWHGDIERERVLVPLQAEMAYLRFHRPGENTVRATVVWDSAGNARWLKRRVGARDCGEWMIELMGGFYPWEYIPDGHFRTHFGSGMYSLGGNEERVVNVPREMFAPDPPKWLDAYIHFFPWFERKPEDQCGWRRRAVVALISAPVFLLVQVLRTAFLVAVIGALWLMGRSPVRYNLLWHPLRGATAILGDLGPSRWYRHRGFWGWALRIVNPATVFVVGLIGSVLAVFGVLSAVLEVVPYVVVGALIAFVGDLAGSTLADRHGKPGAKSKALVERFGLWWAEQEVRRRQKQTAKVVSTIESMVCNGARTPSISALPKDRRTVQLRYQNLKAKVCRPFPRG